MQNHSKNLPPPYFRYWGKSKRSLEVDYCANRLSDTEVAGKHEISKESLREQASRLGWKRVAPGE